MKGIVVAVVLAGCFDSHAPDCTVDCASDRDCPSGLACHGTKCSIGGETCAAPRCSLGDQRCNADAVESCDDAGDWTAQTACATPCVASANTAHCGHLEPSIAALASVCDSPASGPPVVYTSSTLSTSDAVCTVVIDQVDGPPICVVRAPTISVPAAADLRVTGARALALVADGNLVVDGIIDVGALTNVNGPGGGTRQSGVAAVGARGGGGAGFRTDGGDGGGTVAGGGGMGGAAGIDASRSDVLIGGYRPVDDATATIGGGAGGALALISCTGTISVTSILDAAGGGGAGGDPNVAGNRASGAGGGAGGTIHVQAIHVTIGAAAGMYANGGGGGGGSSQLGSIGGVGARGPRLQGCATGGFSFGAAGVGGAGGCTQEPGPGQPSTTSPGGGGGSAGFIIVSTPDGVADIEGPVRFSPPLTTKIVQLR